MKTAVSRQRIEKYLEAHGVNCTEAALMKLTRHLVDTTPEQAKEELKSIILRHKGIDDLANNIMLERSTKDVLNRAKNKPARKSEKIYEESRRTNAGAFMKHVTKTNYILDNLLGFVVSGFIALCIIAGLINYIFFNH